MLLVAYTDKLLSKVSAFITSVFAATITTITIGGDGLVSYPDKVEANVGDTVELNCTFFPSQREKNVDAFYFTTHSRLDQPLCYWFYFLLSQ